MKKMNIKGGLFSKRKQKIICYAPFNNMLIDQQGNVRICCHNNNDFTIGKFPEQSMEEIWFSQSRKELCEDMENGRVPAPCANCIKNGIPSLSPDSKISTSKSDNSSNFKSYPLQIELLLNNECNLSCVMCASNKSSKHTVAGFSGEAVSFDENFLKQMIPFWNHARFVVFSGGEPFLIPIYREIWKYLHENNPSCGIYIQTNGTVLNDKIKQLLKDFPLQIGVSVDALTAEVYEKIRVGAKFDDLWHNLEYLRQYSRDRGHHMTLTMTPMKLNAHEVPNLLDYCLRHELNLSFSILNWPVQLAIWTMTSTELTGLIQEYEAYYQGIKEVSPIAKRNREVLYHFISLIKSYQGSRETAEARQQELREELTTNAAHFKKDFLQNIEVYDISFKTSIRAHIGELQTEFSNQILCEDFIYLAFKGKSTDYFYTLFRKETPGKLKKLGRSRIEELIFLEKNNCFERI